MDIAELQDNATAASDLLKVMANESRLLILCNLIGGEKSVNELEQLVGLRQSALSQHLAVLRRERLVKTRREAQYIYYSLDSDEAKTIMGALHQVFCQGKPACG
ncbi:MAG TPA: metalloregulator ArsR/SmtB family transcription factor [Aestuariivirga sp.]|nr:metalloregulator ArsR/SmtB family transcription factor [Aestuariivirga sp.]